MKIQLDTALKTVKIEDDIKISKLIETLKKLLPNEWKEFTLITHITINDWHPYIIDRWVEPRPRVPYYPWYCASDKSTANYSLQTGTFDVEVKC